MVLLSLEARHETGFAKAAIFRMVSIPYTRVYPKVSVLAA
jgi:hypothetical protein